jgi:hypothetical protein
MFNVWSILAASLPLVASCVPETAFRPVGRNEERPRLDLALRVCRDGEHGERGVSPVQGELAL